MSNFSQESYTTSLPHEINYFYLAKNSTESFDCYDYDVDNAFNLKILIIKDYNPSISATINLISRGDFLRIYNAAGCIKSNIYIVGSRANGTANQTSDWDYIFEPTINNKRWKKIKNSLPGAKSIDNPLRKIDIIHTPLDTQKAFIIITPSILLNQLLGYAELL